MVMLNALLLLLVLVVLSVCSCPDVSWKILCRRTCPAVAAAAVAPPVLLDFGFTNSLRGVAILLVLLGHVSGTMGTVVFTPCGGTGVALFLFLSGYGINESYKRSGLHRYWRKKAARVLFPYFLVISAVYFFGEKDFFSVQYVLDILGLKTSYWYIAFLVKWYVLYWLASRFFLRWRGLLLTAMAIAVLFFFPNIEAEQAFSFVAGYGASVHVARLRALPRRYLWLWGAAAFAVATVALGLKQLPVVRAHEATFVYNLVQCAIKLPYAAAVMAFFTAVRGLARSRFLLLAGALSYELYLVQMPFYVRLDGSLPQALLFCAACFAVAFLLNRLDRRAAAFMR